MRLTVQGPLTIDGVQRQLGPDWKVRTDPTGGTLIASLGGRWESVRITINGWSRSGPAPIKVEDMGQAAIEVGAWMFGFAIVSIGGAITGWAEGWWTAIGGGVLGGGLSAVVAGTIGRRRTTRFVAPLLGTMSL